ncbi:hypothetical protein Dimus_004523 [Dionaea muscipula]
MDHYHFLQLRQQQQQQQQQQQPFLIQDQQQQHEQEQEQPKPFRDLCALDGEVSAPVSYFNSAAGLPDQSHPPYIPQFHVVGFAPGAAAAPGGVDGYAGGNIQWDYGSEQKAKRLREQDFLDSNAHPTSVNFLQPHSVSTGLGLSLENTSGAGSSVDSHFLNIVGDEIDREMQRQNAEMYRYVKIQGDQFRQAILEKIQADRLRTISYIEGKLLQKLHEKEAELESTNRKNIELEERIEQLTSEAGTWQERAKYTENIITLLKFNLQHAYAQSRDSKEGCGESEIDDTASCCEGSGGHALDFRLHGKYNSALKELMSCKLCKFREVCMLLLPCQHLCLCKDCESRVTACPLCQCSKILGMEIYV